MTWPTHAQQHLKTMIDNLSLIIWGKVYLVRLNVFDYVWMNFCCPLYLSFWDSPGDVSTFCDRDISHGSDGNGGTTASGFSIRLSLRWWLPSNWSLVRSWPSSGRNGTNSSWYPIEISSEEWLERLFDLSELASAENYLFRTVRLSLGPGPMIHGPWKRLQNSRFTGQ